MTEPRKTNYVIIIVITVLVLAGVAFMMQRPQGDVAARLDNAAEEIADGVEDAAGELKPGGRTTTEKVGDAIEDAGRDLQDAAKQ